MGSVAGSLRGWLLQVSKRQAEDVVIMLGGHLRVA